jgi:hypothetical protein
MEASGCDLRKFKEAGTVILGPKSPPIASTDIDTVI